MGPDQPAGTVCQAALERATGRVFAAFAALSVTMFWFSSGALRGQRAAAVAANLLLSVLLVWQAARTLRRPPSQRDLYVLAGAAGSLLLVSLALAVPGSPFPGGAAYALVTPVAVAWGAWTNRFVVPVPLLLAVLAAWVWRPSGNLPLEQASLTLAVVACASWAVRLLRAGARRADAEAGALFRRMAEQDAALAAREAERRSANAVHDDVLSVLRAVSLADRPVPWSLVAAKARRALEALTRPSPGESLGLSEVGGHPPPPATASAADPLAWTRRVAPGPRLIFAGFMLPILLAGLIWQCLRWQDMRWPGSAAAAFLGFAGLAMAAAMLAAFRSLSSHIGSQLAAYRERLRLQSRAEAISRADGAALDHARRLAAPVLGAVISSPAPDQDLRTAATLANAALRDELLAPGFLTPPLADCVRAARIAGASISIDFAGQAEEALTETARELLTAALTGLDAGSDLTLQVHPPAEGHPALLLVHARSPRSDHAALRRRAAERGALISDLDGHELLVRLRQPGRL